MDNWPYTNLHDLNLDWIIKTVAEYKDKYVGFDEQVEAAIQRVIAQGDTETEQLETLTQTLKDVVEAAESLAISNIESQKNDSISAVQDAQNTASTAINEQTSLAISNYLSMANIYENRLSTLIAELPADDASLLAKVLLLSKVVSGNVTQNMTWFWTAYEDGKVPSQTGIVSANEISSYAIRGAAGMQITISFLTGQQTDKYIKGVKWYTGYDDENHKYTGLTGVSFQGNQRSVRWAVPDLCYAFSFILGTTNTEFSSTQPSISAFWYTPDELRFEDLEDEVETLEDEVNNLKSTLALVSVPPGTPLEGAYSNVNGVLTFTANSNALAYSVDLSDYIGKIVCVKITSTATSSERLSAMVNDEDKIGESLAERYILPLTYGKCFAITSDYPILKVSHYNSIGSSIEITVYENLLYNAAIVPDIITDINALVDSVGRTGINISSGLSNSYFTVSDNTISETPANNSRSKVIDLTQYIGKRVWLKISTTATTSTRVSAIGNAQGTVNAYYTEAQINNSADGVFFDITSDYHYLYISWYYILGQSPEAYVIWGLYDEIQQINEQIHPNVVYVDGTNASSGDGTKANPYNTLQAGINSGAEIIKVKEGTYAAFSVNDRDYPLTVMLDEMPEYVASATAQDLPKIHIEDPTKYNGVDINNCAEVHLFDIWVDSSPRYNFNLTNIQNLEMTRCYANTNDTANFSTFRFVNVNAVVKDCIAWESKLDGFNIHGYGDTQFINCIAYDCGDDGISHHDSCTGCIIGGEFYGNGKGGISSPYGGARIDVQGAYCHDNTRYGLYADSDESHPSIYARVSDCLFVDNGQADVYVADGTVVSWNTLYKTKSIQESATFAEYNNTILT